MEEGAKFALEKYSIEEFKKIALTDPSELWQYFIEHDFDRMNVLAIFNDNSLVRGIKYALTLKRAFILLNSETERFGILLSKYSPRTVTFFGERENFSYDFIRKVNQIDLPISIFTAADESGLEHLIAKTIDNVIITIQSPFIADLKGFVPSDENAAARLIASIRESDALLLNVHGDILCANLGAGVLCSTGNASRGEQTVFSPACAITRDCFRRNRFNAKISFRKMLFEELKAKVIFMNTCGGISFVGNKYDGFAHIMPFESIKSKAIVYISNYLILANNREEMYLFWGLLQVFGNFSISTFYLNRIVKRERVTLMLGDGIVNLKVAKDIDDRAKMTTSDHEKVILRFEDIKNKTLYIKLNRGEHLVLCDNSDNEFAIFIDKNVVSSCGYFVQKDEMHVIVHFHVRIPDKINVLVYPLAFFKRRIDEISRMTSALSIAKYLNIQGSYTNGLLNLSEEIQEQYNNLMELMKLNDLSAVKYFFIQKMARHIETKMSVYFKSLVEAIIIHSVNSDTHLMLKESSLICQNPVHKTNCVCYICKETIHEITYSYGINPDKGFLISLCPLCEIISVRNIKTNIMEIDFPSAIRAGRVGILRLRCNIDADVSFVQLGVALINGFKILNTRLRARSHLAVEEKVTIPKSLSPGMYYLRCVLLLDGLVSISHKRLYIEHFAET